MWMTSDTGSVRAEDFGDFEKVSELSWVELSWVLPREKMVDFHLLAEALGRCARVGGADGKARIERMCISLLMLKNF